MQIAAPSCFFSRALPYRLLSGHTRPAGTALTGGAGAPLGQNDNSFPSGRASRRAGVSARLTHNTLGNYDLPRAARVASNAGLAGLALMTGWGRVEAGKHRPADVLADAALGNFFAVIGTETVLRPAAGESTALNVSPCPDGWALDVSFPF